MKGAITVRGERNCHILLVLNMSNERALVHLCDFIPMKPDTLGCLATKVEEDILGIGGPFHSSPGQ